MARTTKVREDAQGLFVRADGRLFRPGHVNGLPRADMTDGGLRLGDEIKARHVSGTTRCRVTKADGSELFWHTEYQHQLEAKSAAALTEMRASGIDPHAELRALLGGRLVEARVERVTGDNGDADPSPLPGPRR